MPQGQHPAGSGSAQLPGCRPSGQNAATSPDNPFLDQVAAGLATVGARIQQYVDAASAKD